MSREDYIEHPSGLSAYVLPAALRQYVAAEGFPGAPAYAEDWNLRAADLERRTMESLLAGVSRTDGRVRLADPATWIHAPGMPSQAQRMITEVLDTYAGKRQDVPNPGQEPARTPGKESRQSPTATARHPTATAGLTALALTYADRPLGHRTSTVAHRRAFSDPRTAGGCVWEHPDKVPNTLEMDRELRL